MSDGDDVAAEGGVRRLDDFSVVAVRGRGVWVVGEGGSGWHVGGPNPAADEDDPLVQAYRSAFDE